MSGAQITLQQLVCCSKEILIVRVINKYEEEKQRHRLNDLCNE